VSDVIALLSPSEAQRLTQRIKLVASSVRDNLFKLRNLVDEAKNSNVWNILGYQSWTAYLADTLADEPMRLGRDERQELVGYLAGEGLSNRAIAPILGVTEGTVRNDLSGAQSYAPASVSDTHHEFPTADVWTPDTGFVNGATGEIISVAPVIAPVNTPEPRTITGLDGKTYEQKPRTERRRSLLDDTYAANTRLWEAVERIRSITTDDRYTRNKADVLAALQPSADLALSVLTDLFKPSERN
jgi:hypothetical protein